MGWIGRLTLTYMPVVVHSLSHVQFFATPWAAARQAPLFSTISQSLLKVMSIESVMLPNHLILCCPFSFCLQSFRASGSFPHIHCAALCLVAQSCLILCDPVDCSPPGSSVHGDSPGKNPGVGCHALLQGIPHCRQILYYLCHQGSP